MCVVDGFCSPDSSTFAASVVRRVYERCHAKEVDLFCCREQTCQFLMYSVDLLTILLCYNSFTRIQIILDNFGYIPPNSDHSRLLVELRLMKVLLCFILIQPLCRTSFIVVKNPLFYHTLKCNQKMGRFLR